MLPLFFLFASGVPWSELIDQAALEERQGRYQDADRTLRRALQAAKEESRSQRDLGLTLNNLGGVQVLLGEFVAAEKNLNLAMHHFRDTGNAGSEWTFPLNHLAILYRRTGRLQKAEQAYRQVLAERERTSTTADAFVARIHANLGSVLMEQKRLPEATQFLEKALQSFQALPGMGEDQATTLVNLSVLHWLAGDRPRATERAADAVVVLERCVPAGHPRLGASLLNLGAIELESGNVQDALLHMNKAVQILEGALPSTHTMVADALFQYSDALRKSGKKREAKSIRQKASSISGELPRVDLGKHQISISDLKAK